MTVEFGGVAMLKDTTHAPHPICGASCTDNKQHVKTTFTYWLDSDYGEDAKSLILRVGGENHSTYGDPLDAGGSAWTLPEGTYYLADDIHIDKPIKIYGNVTICLNGHDISVDKGVFAFEIYQYNNAKKGKLTLTDCKENCGEVKSHDTDKRALGGVDIIDNSTFEMYGGKISGCKRGVYVNSYGTFNMYGGGNSSNTVGGDDGSSSGENGSNMEGGNDSVSSGGNSSSWNDSDTESDNDSGSNNNIPATPVTIPVSGDEKTIRVDAMVSGTTATIANVDFSKLDTVIGDNVKTGVVTIDFSVLEKKVDTVKLPARWYIH